jgi:hypothetical protein
VSLGDWQGKSLSFAGFEFHPGDYFPKNLVMDLQEISYYFNSPLATVNWKTIFPINILWKKENTTSFGSFDRIVK